jgi:pimeloyl-ACP methyl ester carboxylesterase
MTTSTTKHPKRPASALKHRASALKHRAMLLGERESILAIASEPAQPDPARPICLMLNAGIIHRVGAHRNAVRIARGLARAGLTTLRVDLSGIGDSPRRRDALGFNASAVADVRELLDHLGRSYDNQRFVLIGLCSGADNAFQSAIVDDRIAGAAFIDGYAYPTPEFRLRHITRRVAAQGTLIGAARKSLGKLGDGFIAAGQQRLPQVFGTAPAEEAGLPPAVPDYERDFPPRDEVAGQLQMLVERDFRMLWLFTGGVSSYFNYPEQVRDSFPEVDFRDRLEVVHVADSNHTATAIASQRKVADAIVSWARQSF